MEKYRHTQTGNLIRAWGAASLVLFAVLLGVNLRTPESTPAIFFGVCFIVIAIALALFHSLTVVVRDDAIALSFGAGLIRKSFSTAEVSEIKTVRNPWWYGWGIHLTPHGWLFNVSGFDAVELTMANGRKYRIGTDAPAELEQAIRNVKKS